MASSSVRDAPKVGVHRTKSQVFVEIPPSPLLGKSRFAPQPPKVDKLSNQHEGHKENAVPLSTKTPMNNIPTSAKDNGKRKLQDADNVETKTNSKKARILRADDDNLVVCHQCRSKKTPEAVLQCTSNLKKTGKRCKASYCSTCLKIRYGEKLQEISQRKLPRSRDGHDPDTTYHFTCPRCSDFCNCAPCRKKKGLAPVGKFALTEEEGSVREILEKNPQASGTLPRNVVVPTTKFSKPADAEGVAVAGTKPKESTDHKRKTKIKAAPEPVWRPLPQTYTRQEIEDRIHLREFILRFNPILDISLRNVEELDDFSTLHDQSTKAILIALLDLIAVEDDAQKRKIQATVKKVRGLGLNWTKIVPVLFELRDSMPQKHALRSLPDLEQSETEATYNTRGTRMQGFQVDQLLPVLLYLADVASNGESVRQELEEGVKQAKEVRAAYLKAQREETERWAAERAELVEEKQEVKSKGLAIAAFKAKYREAESKHKAIVLDIHNSYKPDMNVCSPRFMSLGTDMEGRTYYALSASGPQRGKKERIPGEGERSKKWGWFISVWGKPGTIVDGEDAMDEGEETDPSAGRWWSFADVQEIRKLSNWLAYRADTDMAGKEDNNPASISADDTSRTLTPSATSSTLTSRHSWKNAATPVPRNRPPSPLSAISDSDSEANDEMPVDGEADGRVDTNLSLPATQTGVKALAKSILEFADFIEWRMGGERLAK